MLYLLISISYLPIQTIILTPNCTTTTYYNGLNNIVQGEYLQIVIFKTIFQYDSPLTNDIKYNMYLGKKSDTSTKFKGNITGITFHDSLDVSYNYLTFKKNSLTSNRIKY